MLGHLLTWTRRVEVDGGTVVNFEGVTLSRDLGDKLRQGAAFRRATFDRLTGVLDLYAGDGGDHSTPIASAKLRLVAVADHDDLVTHAPVWRALFAEKLARLSAWPGMVDDGEIAKPRALGPGLERWRTADDERDARQEIRDDIAYWEHELKAFERRVARARSES